MERSGGLGSSGEEQGAVGKDREQWGGTGCSGEGQGEVRTDSERWGGIGRGSLHRFW